MRLGIDMNVFLRRQRRLVDEWFPGGRPERACSGLTPRTACAAGSGAMARAAQIHEIDRLVHPKQPSIWSVMTMCGRRPAAVWLCIQLPVGL